MDSSTIVYQSSTGVYAAHGFVTQLGRVIVLLIIQIQFIVVSLAVDEVLKQGHVPPRYAIYVERKEMTEKIRTELYKLKDTDGWVVVHGMPGFGKTVLAAEAVRDAQLLREVFPGGVNAIDLPTEGGSVTLPKCIL